MYIFSIYKICSKTDRYSATCFWCRETWKVVKISQSEFFPNKILIYLLARELKIVFANFDFGAHGLGVRLYLGLSEWDIRRVCPFRWLNSIVPIRQSTSLIRDRQNNSRDSTSYLKRGISRPSKLLCHQTYPFADFLSLHLHTVDLTCVSISHTIA